jgi:hypothetical protein
MSSIGGYCIPYRRSCPSSYKAPIDEVPILSKSAAVEDLENKNENNGSPFPLFLSSPPWNSKNAPGQRTRERERVRFLRLELVRSLYYSHKF